MKYNRQIYKKISLINKFIEAIFASSKIYRLGSSAGRASPF